MSLDAFLNQAWNDHATKIHEVMNRLPDGVKLLEKNEQFPLLAHLVGHVYGEHLAQWDAGIKFLQTLKKNPHYIAGSESEKAIDRTVASLELAGGTRKAVADFLLSDQIRIMAIAASALADRAPAKAQELFKEALLKAQSGIAKDDPANRALAVAGNNLAAAIEEKATRSAEEIPLMILAAQTGRKFWEIAGTWLHVERAEYRLAKVFIAANDLHQALSHVHECLRIVRENNADALEYFFAHEALFNLEKRRDNAAGAAEALEQVKIYFDKLSPENKSWCELILKQLS